MPTIPKFEVEDSSAAVRGRSPLLGVGITFDELTLHGIVDLTERDRFRSHAENVGDVSQVTTADGGWVTLDRSGSGSILTTTLPDSVKPPLVDDDYYLIGYDESAVDMSGALTEINLTLQRHEPREPEDPNNVLAESAGTDEWEFGFQHGTVATPFVEVATQQTRDVTLTASFTAAQAEVLAESATFLNAVSVENIADGDDFSRDNHPNTRNTVSITSPSSIDARHFDDGDFQIRDWSIQSTGRSRWDVSMTVIKF